MEHILTGIKVTLQDITIAEGAYSRPKRRIFHILCTDIPPDLIAGTPARVAAPYVFCVNMINTHITIIFSVYKNMCTIGIVLPYKISTVTKIHLCEKLKIIIFLKINMFLSSQWL